MERILERMGELSSDTKGLEIERPREHDNQGAQVSDIPNGAIVPPNARDFAATRLSDCRLGGAVVEYRAPNLHHFSHPPSRGKFMTRDQAFRRGSLNEVTQDKLTRLFS